MTHNITEQDGTVVGFIEVLQDEDLSITFHGVWVGVFSTFEAWNCQYGGVYTQSCLNSAAIFNSDWFNEILKL